jgi:hypothetical protein
LTAGVPECLFAHKYFEHIYFVWKSCTLDYDGNVNEVMVLSTKRGHLRGARYARQIDRTIGENLDGGRLFRATFASWTAVGAASRKLSAMNRQMYPDIRFRAAIHN